jgi:hypothetical protein
MADPEWDIKYGPVVRGMQQGLFFKANDTFWKQ